MAPIRLLVLAISLAGVIALGAPVGASAAQPCWKQIYDDWYQNERIDRSYSKACYAAAEKNIPQDLRDYSDLPGEIERARLRDLRADNAGSGDNGNDGRSLQGVGGAGPVDTRSDDDGDGGAGGNSGDGAIGSALDALGPSSADSAPIPLLVLAGLALLLVAAGAAGLLSRKLNARRARVTPPSTPDV
jgi:hypothetical protein